MDSQIPMVREIILERIADILQNLYKDPAMDLSEETLSAKLAFRADPQLNELRLALERMKRGEFGRCIFCKGEITVDLLKTNPTAHFCHQCTGILRYRISLPRAEQASSIVLNPRLSPENSTSISG